MYGKNNFFINIQKIAFFYNTFSKKVLKVLCYFISFSFIMNEGRTKLIVHKVFAID